MKKLSYRQKLWLIRRAFDQESRNQKKTRRLGRSPSLLRKKPKYFSKVLLWQGGDPEIATCISRPAKPPRSLDFSSSLEETIAFFEQVRSNFDASMHYNKSFIVRDPKIGPVITGYSDFSVVEQISTAAAVVLAADYERLKILFGEVPPTVNLHEWSKPVFTKLFQLGFFGILGHAPNTDNKLVEDGTSLTMQIVSAKNADAFRLIDESIQKLGNFLIEGMPAEAGLQMDQNIIDLLTSISEAITNVTQHAYPSDHNFEVECVKRYWVSATAERVDNSLTIVVYDQGAMIPVTYPRMTLGGKALQFLARALKRESLEFDYINDRTYIRAAMKYGRSQTDEPFRGKGFPQMFRQMKKVGCGQMRVFSRGGSCIRPTKGKTEGKSFRNSLGGTLVEWKVELPTET